MSKRVMVLFSGGIDSTTCLTKAIKENGNNNVMALTLLYGQKHAKEIESAKAISEYYDINLIIEDITQVFRFDKKCTLLKGNSEVQLAPYQIQSEQKQNKPIDTYVPFRNGLMLSYATAIALSLDYELIYYGAHADDLSYPDCSEQFNFHMQQAIKIGTGDKITLEAPFVSLEKQDVIRYGIKNNTPYHLTWSCYTGNLKPCGKCPSCLTRVDAFAKNNVADPIDYDI